ncbi:Uncharacterised protein [Vibrio cholerae]|nr:Uncharacterised protein [Vibrio cholerae]
MRRSPSSTSRYRRNLYRSCLQHVILNPYSKRPWSAGFSWRSFSPRLEHGDRSYLHVTLGLPRYP